MIPVGSSLWKDIMHEPLVLTLIFPLLNYSPWQVRNTQGLVELASSLPRVWSPHWATEGHCLRKFWSHEVPGDPDLLWDMAR
jgi:hypothetical protein